MDKMLPNFDAVANILYATAVELGIDVRILKEHGPIIMVFRTHDDMNYYKLCGSLKEGEVVYYPENNHAVTSARIDFTVLPEEYE